MHIVVSEEAIQLLGEICRNKQSVPHCFACNLSLAYYNEGIRKKKHDSYWKKAFELDKTDSRIFMELDQLYKRDGKKGTCRTSGTPGRNIWIW